MYDTIYTEGVDKMLIEKIYDLEKEWAELNRDKSHLTELQEKVWIVERARATDRIIEKLEVIYDTIEAIIEQTFDAISQIELMDEKDVNALDQIKHNMLYKIEK